LELALQTVSAWWDVSAGGGRAGLVELSNLACSIDATSTDALLRVGARITDRDTVGLLACALDTRVQGTTGEDVEREIGVKSGGVLEANISSSAGVAVLHIGGKAAAGVVLLACVWWRAEAVGGIVVR